MQEFKDLSGRRALGEDSGLSGPLALKLMRVSGMLLFSTKSNQGRACPPSTSGDAPTFSHVPGAYILRRHPHPPRHRPPGRPLVGNISSAPPNTYTLRSSCVDWRSRYKSPSLYLQVLRTRTESDQDASLDPANFST